jgi:hypothetical protein
MDSILAFAQENGSASSGSSGLWYILTAIGLWKMFEKAGEPGWTGIVPFYNQYKLCEKVMNNPWYWVRLFVVVVPVIGWFMYFYFAYQIGKATAKAYGQPDSWAWGYTFLAPVFYCITGFSNQYDYYGPYGKGDRRSSEARQARTVDFDVQKQEPSVEKVQPVVEKVKPAPAKDESEVEFDFNQDITE